MCEKFLTDGGVQLYKDEDDLHGVFLWVLNLKWMVSSVLEEMIIHISLHWHTKNACAKWDASVLGFIIHWAAVQKTSKYTKLNPVIGI